MPRRLEVLTFTQVLFSSHAERVKVYHLWSLSFVCVCVCVVCACVCRTAVGVDTVTAFARVWMCARVCYVWICVGTVYSNVCGRGDGGGDGGAGGGYRVRICD